MLLLIKKTIGAVLLSMILLGFFFLTNPSDLPLAALFVPFLLIYACTFLILREISLLLMKSVKDSYRLWIVGAIAFIPVALLLTLSAGQTDAKDVLLFFLLVILLIFYFSRTNFLK